jgi:acyl-CoA synthetase (AMP-forming)/AMP-acid ligase II
MTSFRALNQEYDNALRRFPADRVAFGDERVPVTFAAFARSVDELMAGLHAQGVRPGNAVGYCLPNCAEALAIIVAISRLGAKAVPVFPMMPDARRAQVFAALDCSLVITTGAAAEGLARAAAQLSAGFRVIALEAVAGIRGASNIDPFESSPDQELLAATTSGTTGIPKLVWMTQGNVASVLAAAADLVRVGSWQLDPDYTTMAAFPLSTSGVLMQLGMIFAGTRVVFARDVSPGHFLELAEHWSAEALSAPPAYFEAILSLPPPLRRSLPAVRAVMSGMDFVHTSLLMRLAERFPGLDRAAAGYGLVETALVFMTWKAHDRGQLQLPPGCYTLCVGLGNQIDVRDESAQSLPVGEVGVLWVKGPSVVPGYLGNPAESASAFVDGWFRTGDVAVRVDERTIELRGRQKYLIKRGGKSISPIEVQEHLDACQGVRTSGVVGVKHPLYGEMIWAFVVPNGEPPVTLKDIMKACRATLPNYMVPDQVTFVSELPRGAGVGKLDREALIRMAEEELGRIQGESRG